MALGCGDLHVARQFESLLGVPRVGTGIRLGRKRDGAHELRRGSTSPSRPRWCRWRPVADETHIPMATAACGACP